MSALNVEQVSTDTQQQYSEVFPLVYCNNKGNGDSSLADAQVWVTENRERVIQELAVHGAVLFRDFPITTDTDFDAFLSAFELPNFTYADSFSNAVRRNRTERVFTANEAPPSVSIFLHHEMAQTPVFPAQLFFFCELAPDEGGATPLCRSDILLERLEERLPEFVADCEEQGVRYSNVMPSVDDLDSGQGRSWRSTLSVDSKADAEAKLEALGYDWQWLEADSLRVTTAVLPAVKTLADGRRVFFNQLIAAFRGWKDSRNAAEKSIRFGDDSEISTQAMAIAIELGDELSYDLEWQSGDVALVDNFLVMHGRRPYQGQRRVLASLVAGS
jgi:hypothetical protein